MGIMVASLIISCLTFILLAVWVAIMGVWHFKKDKKHEIERNELRESRDYHIDALIKRSKDVDLY